MKITDWPKVTSLMPNNVFLIDGPDGTKGILASDLITPEMHRTIFRGKNLGTVVTGAQQAAIQNGTFEDLFVGDYWEIGGIVWRIVDINYWLGCGDVEFTANHLVIMPDNQLYTANMNATSITTGGYTGSLMRATNLASAKTTIRAAFGSLVKTKRALFENTVTLGRPASGGWFDSDIDLLSEINAFGTFFYRPMNNGVDASYNYMIDRQQFALFAIKPRFIVTSPVRNSYWLRDPGSATSFASIFSSGPATYNTASTSIGVRPCFAIG